MSMSVIAFWRSESGLVPSRNPSELGPSAREIRGNGSVIINDFQRCHAPLASCPKNCLAGGGAPLFGSDPSQANPFSGWVSHLHRCCYQVWLNSMMPAISSFTRPTPKRVSTRYLNFFVLMSKNLNMASCTQTSVVPCIIASPTEESKPLRPGSSSIARLSQNIETLDDTVFRNVIAAPLAGVAVTFLYSLSAWVGELSAAMIGGLMVTTPLPPAPDTMAVMVKVLSWPVSALVM